MSRSALLAAATSVIAACSSPPPIHAPVPSADPANVLAGAIRGTLYRSGDCVLFRHGDRSLVPVWPHGTQLSAVGVTLPAPNGGKLLRFNDLVYLFGTPAKGARIGNSLPGLAPAADCGSEAFIVSRAETQRQLQASAAAAPYTSGLLVRRGQCLVVENVEGALLPIWPEGTKITATHVIMPGGGPPPLVIGARAGIHGRYVYRDDGGLQRLVGAQSECAPRGVIVEKANRVYLANNAVEAAAQSDGVLVLRIDRANTADRRPDGFQTTLEATILDVLSGPYRAGDKLRVRHVVGQSSPVLAHPVTIPAAGDTVLLFVLQDFYRQQAEARGGNPQPGFVGAGGGMYRIVDGRIISEHDLQMPETLEELKRQLSHP